MIVVGKRKKEILLYYYVANKVKLSWVQHHTIETLSLGLVVKACC